MAQQIVLARIDDRLIHGQVMTAWVGHVGAKDILIVDDKVASDPFLAGVITAAVPSSMRAKAVTVADAISRLAPGGDSEEGNIVLLAKGPETYEALVDGGVPITEINLGGMGSKQERQLLYRNISASPAERASFKRLIEKGTTVYIQVVPNSECVDIAKYL